MNPITSPIASLTSSTIITKQHIPICKLKPNELHERLKVLVYQERKLIHILLQHIAEVDRRQLYLEWAYPSLYEYLVKGLGYSEAAGQRRVDAARLITQIPEVGVKIAEGKIQLSQISEVQKAFRQAAKNLNSDKSNTTYSHESLLREKKKILERIEDKTFQETQLILQKNFSFPIIQNEKIKIQADESVRVEFTLTKQETQMIEEAKVLLSHSVPSGKIKDLIVYCSQKVICEKFGKMGIKTLQNIRSRD